MTDQSGKKMSVSHQANDGLRRLARLVARFRRDRRGVAAVEFGFIAPVLLLLLIGAVEVTRAVAIDRRVSIATNMVADLVAREDKQLTKADVNAIYGIVERVMAPYDASALKISLIPVAASDKDKTKTAVYPATTNRPSYNGGAQPAKCEAYPLPSGLVEAKDSVIVVETTYAFTPMLVGYVMGKSTWKDKAYAKPRGSCVPFDSAQCINDCFN
jgi:Flp pilus assembly protein TadG